MVELIPIVIILAMILLCIFSVVNNTRLFRMAILAGVYATRYSFPNDVQIEARDQKDKTRKWVIHSFREVWDKENNCFVWESMPSERADEFIRQTRFNTFDEAYKCYKKTVGPLIQAELNEMLAKRKMKQSSPTTNT